MSAKKILVATLLTGAVLNVFDFLVHGTLLADMYGRLSWLLRQDASMAWLVVGDFVAALVLVLVYARVVSSFGGGVRGGATFGLYAGVLVNFPTWIFAHLLLVGFPYSLSWVWIVTGVAGAVVAGATIGMLNRPAAMAATA